MPRAEGGTSTDDVRITLLTRERVPELVPLLDDGFGSKRCCCCCADSLDDTISSGLPARTVKAYAEYPDAKIAACGIAVEHTSDGQTVVGLCQLTLPGLPGDFDEPEWMQHQVEPNEGYIDRLVVASRMRGRGIGQRLLDWADETCRGWRPQGGSAEAAPAPAAVMERGAEPLLPAVVGASLAEPARISRISLHVVHGNPAIRLYERDGYVAQHAGCCERCCTSCVTLWLMRKSGVTLMTKQLGVQSSQGTVLRLTAEALN